MWFDKGDLWILSTGDHAGNRVSACGLLQGMTSSASLPFHPARLLPQNVRHVPLPCHGRLVIFDSGFDPRLQARIADAGTGVSHMGHCASLVRQLLCLSQKQSHTQNPSESATKPLWHSQKCRSIWISRLCDMLRLESNVALQDQTWHKWASDCRTCPVPFSQKYRNCRDVIIY